MMTKRCVKCGGQNAGDALQCIQCGNDFPAQMRLELQRLRALLEEVNSNPVFELPKADVIAHYETRIRELTQRLQEALQQQWGLVPSGKAGAPGTPTIDTVAAQAPVPKETPAPVPVQAAPPKESSTPAPVREPAEATPRSFFSLQNIHVLLYLGVFTFGTALAVFVHSQWKDMQPAGKAALLWSGSALLMGIGRLLRTRFKLPSSALAFTMLGAFTVPIDLYACVYYGVIPGDPQWIGLASSVLCAGLYAGMARYIHNEVFGYAAALSGQSAVWFGCAAAGLDSREALGWLMFVPALYHVLHCLMARGSWLSWVVLHRPLVFSSQVLMGSLAMFFLDQGGHFFDAELWPHVLLVGVCGVAFYQMTADYFCKPWVLWICALFQFQLVHVLLDWFAVPPTWHALWYGVWAVSLFAQSLRYARNPELQGFARVLRAVGWLVMACCLLDFYGRTGEERHGIGVLLYVFATLGAASYCVGSVSKLAAARMFAFGLAVVFYGLRALQLEPSAALPGVAVAAVAFALGSWHWRAKVSVALADGAWMVLLGLGALCILLPLQYFETDANVLQKALHGSALAVLAVGTGLTSWQHRAGMGMVWGFALLQGAVFAFLCAAGLSYPTIAMSMTALQALPLLCPRTQFLQPVAGVSLALGSAVPLMIFGKLEPAAALEANNYFSACVGIAGVAWLIEHVRVRTAPTAYAALLLLAGAYWVWLQRAYSLSDQPLGWAAFPLFFYVVYAAQRLGGLTELRDAAINLLCVASSLLLALAIACHSKLGHVEFHGLAEFQWLVSGVLLAAVFTHRGESQDQKGVLAVVMPLFVLMEIALWLTGHGMGTTGVVLCLQGASVLLLGFAWLHRKRGELDLSVGMMYSMFVAQGFIVWLAWPHWTGVGAALLCAGAGSAAVAVWSRAKHSEIFSYCSVAQFTLGYIGLLYGLDIHTLPMFVVAIAFLCVLQATAANVTRNDWSVAWTATTVAVSVWCGYVMFTDLGSLRESQGHGVALGLLCVAVAYYLLYRSSQFSQYLLCAVMCPILAYYVELDHYAVATLEAYTVPVGAIIAAWGLYAAVRGRMPEASARWVWAALVLIVPSFLQQFDNRHALYGLILSAGVLLLAMKFRAKRAFFIALCAFVLIILIKTGQFLNLQTRSRAEWGMLLGAILIAAGAAAELYRKRVFDKHIEKGRELYIRSFEHWH